MPSRTMRGSNIHKITLPITGQEKAAMAWRWSPSGPDPRLWGATAVPTAASGGAPSGVRVLHQIRAVLSASGGLIAVSNADCDPHYVGRVTHGTLFALRLRHNAQLRTLIPQTRCETCETSKRIATH